MCNDSSIIFTQNVHISLNNLQSSHFSKTNLVSLFPLCSQDFRNNKSKRTKKGKRSSRIHTSICRLLPSVDQTAVPPNQTKNKKQTHASTCRWHGDAGQTGRDRFMAQLGL